jgi:hypothetical protein
MAMSTFVLELLLLCSKTTLDLGNIEAAHDTRNEGIFVHVEASENAAAHGRWSCFRAKKLNHSNRASSVQKLGGSRGELVLLFHKNSHKDLERDQVKTPI